MTPFRVDEGLPDGVRDRFQWGRFASPGWLTSFAVLLVLVALLSTTRPDSRARGDAVQLGLAVGGEARSVVHRIIDSR